MKKGCVKLKVKITKGDEAGLYRINEEGAEYLTFSFNNSDEAKEKGKKIAAILEVPFTVDLSRPIRPSEKEVKKEEKQKEQFTKEKRKEERIQRKITVQTDRESKLALKRQKSKQRRLLKQQERLQKKLAKVDPSLLNLVDKL